MNASMKVLFVLLLAASGFSRANTAAPAAGDADHQGCAARMAKFDAVKASHPVAWDYRKALVLRAAGAIRCRDGEYSVGASKLDEALRDLRVEPVLAGKS